MKRFIPTILLVVICIGGFWYASSKNFFQEKKDEPKSLITLKQEDVQSIHVKKEEQQIELARNGSGWDMKTPAAAPINTNQVGSWLDALGLVTSTKLVEDQVSNLSNYGLDKPVGTYEVTLKDGSKKGLLVGTALPIEGFSYVQVEGSPAVYQVSDQLLSALSKKPVDFADASPVQFESDKVQSVKLTWKGQTYTLAKTDKDKVAAEANWKLGDKELKGAEATPLLNELNFLHSAELPQPAAQKPTAGSELKIELGLTVDGKEVTEIYEGKLSQDQVWLTKQGGQWAYLLTAADIQKLADAYAGKPAQPAS
ncbi:DUF4340 domain-containing protein [Paenibacillus alginolyticus]|uniref:DUF4340 domain-containing protein n=1 Tax=Paenibacillus alginolyticus TaxID=59839 RepID=A0ABT4G8B2_9BACL|nr:DUF4340 domain-containing protein [Paenibacillus alginolyticus]MCY9692422.1 DUF4340 domain-containing protein [Paenibacillus alginolyticus]MEC0143605.1 DUF4340 domain-containing protein [Paenibacillus alginolyticus]